MIDDEALYASIWSGRWSVLRLPIERLAERRGEAVWTVGGVPRDLILGREPADFDCVVEGDGMAFAAELAALLGVGIGRYDRFLTAELELPGVGRVDVSTARRETYEEPGHLPTVERAGLDEDLERRDFTINTFALGLGGGVAGRLRSHPNASEDLDRRWIRVLHRRSFLDDPTRLLRAVDLEVAIGGDLEPETEALARSAIEGGALGTVTGERLWVPVRESLSDRRSLPGILGRWSDLGLWGELFPGFGAVTDRIGLVEATVDLLGELAGAEGSAGGDAPAAEQVLTAVLLALVRDAPSRSTRAWVERLGPPKELRRTLLGAATRLAPALCVVGGKEAPPSIDHAALRELSVAELAVVGTAAGPGAAERVTRELAVSRRLTLGIGARDLIERGVRPGPSIGEALERTLAARLDGDIGAGDELEFALARALG